MCIATQIYKKEIPYDSSHPLTFHQRNNNKKKKKKIKQLAYPTWVKSGSLN